MLHPGHPRSRSWNSQSRAPLAQPFVPQVTDSGSVPCPASWASVALKVRTWAELAKLAGRVVRTQPQGSQGRTGSGAKAERARQESPAGDRTRVGFQQATRVPSGSFCNIPPCPCPGPTCGCSPEGRRGSGGSAAGVPRPPPALGEGRQPASCCCFQRFPATRPASPPGRLPTADPPLRGRGAKTRPGSPSQAPLTTRRRGKTRPG